MLDLLGHAVRGLCCLHTVIGAFAAAFLVACGGAGESFPGADLGTGISITADGAVVVTPARADLGATP